ncbi:MAG: DUF2383 domain-containing protein [Burkholderiales bacterium]|nr:DUF2383 domain-containing protein [Burkholderiales bacterium]
MTQARVSEILDDLIEVCREEESCYRRCLQVLKKDALRRVLRRRAGQAARAQRALAKLRKAMGARECTGPVLAQPAKMNEAHAFGAVSDEASALGMCERVEAVVLMRYRDALDFELPEPVRRLLQRQFDALLARRSVREVVTTPPQPQRDTSRPHTVAVLVR